MRGSARPSCWRLASPNRNHSRSARSLCRLTARNEVRRGVARSHENPVSTRDCPAKAGADARIEESAANGEIRLALRPYGSSDCRPSLLVQLYSRGAIDGGEGRRVSCSGQAFASRTHPRTAQPTPRPPSSLYHLRQPHLHEGTPLRQLAFSPPLVRTIKRAGRLGRSGSTRPVPAMYVRDYLSKLISDAFLSH